MLNFQAINRQINYLTLRSRQSLVKHIFHPHISTTRNAKRILMCKFPDKTFPEKRIYQVVKSPGMKQQSNSDNKYETTNC